MNKSMQIGTRKFDLDNGAYIMGILNVTPDSFSDGNKYNEIDTALKHVENMIDDGMDILDIGGESTRPNYTKISDEEEIQRVSNVIIEIKKRFDIPISVDTYKSKVAENALCVGADMINDIWGLNYDDKMAEVIKKYDVPVCIMHNNKENVYSIQDVINDLQISIDKAYDNGINKDKIIIDPGIGFAKNLEINLNVMNNLEKLKIFDLPILLGTSRKSMIGLTLDLPVNEREEGTMATTVIGLIKGCSFFRVHNVRANVRTIKMAQAILNA